MKKNVVNIINIILLIILMPILIISLILIIKSYIDKDNVPSVFGYSPLIVLSGSMETEIYTGDLVVVKKVKEDTIKEGDIIAFYTDSSKETIITHRIMEIKEEDGKIKYITKGDSNITKDAEEVDSDLVVGKYINIRMKGLGNTAMFLQTPTGMAVIISIPILILVVTQYIQNRQDKKELEELRKEKNNKN